MTTTDTSGQSFDQAAEHEIRAILIRHLPVGLEGVGIAQAEAVMSTLHRHSTARSRPTLNEAHRGGMRLLRDTAEAHGASVSGPSPTTQHCGCCLTRLGAPQSWPCPVWSAAELLGLVQSSTRPIF